MIRWNWSARIEDDDCCLNNSAAVEVVLKRELSTLFTDFLSEADLVIAPTLLITEATNVFWKYQKFSDFPYELTMDQRLLASAEKAGVNTV